MNSRELPWDRLATTDELGNRIYLYASDVHGVWKRRRSWLGLGLIIVFLILPWVRLGGHQAILLDIPNRRFALLGLTFWAHDAPLLFFVLGAAAIFIAFITAVWGRVWCGWACPQTVFIEHVFRRVERWIEGDALARRKLDQGRLNAEKFWKKTVKWGIFTLLSLVLSHSFLAYFVGSDVLGKMIESSPFQNPVVFLVMASVTGAILFDLGWFREQFCTVVCPYGRFQSVLMDDQSSLVAYDARRGEPRRGVALENVPSGDCVNCYRCVQVCPTGVDIRRGAQQLECIACTACIDACNDVMMRLKKPLHLIRYASQAMMERGAQSFVPGFKRTRVWVYLFLWITCLGGLAWTASHRLPIELSLIRAVDAPYQEIPSEKFLEKSEILNHFKADLRNQTFEEQEIVFLLSPEIKAQGVSLVVSNHKNTLAPGESERADVFVQFPKKILQNGRGMVPIQIQAKSVKATQDLPRILHMQEAHLVGPYF